MLLLLIKASSASLSLLAKKTSYKERIDKSSNWLAGLTSKINFQTFDFLNKPTNQLGFKPLEL